MSLRVFVEIGGLDVRQQHGDPAGVPVGAVWCSDAGCWLREFKDDEAAERGARALCYHRTECDTYWDERPETHDDWRQSARVVLLAAIGGET